MLLRTGKLIWTAVFGKVLLRITAPLVHLLTDNSYRTFVHKRGGEAALFTGRNHNTRLAHQDSRTRSQCTHHATKLLGWPHPQRASEQIKVDQSTCPITLAWQRGIWEGTHHIVVHYLCETSQGFQIELKLTPVLKPLPVCSIQSYWHCRQVAALGFLSGSRSDSQHDPPRYDDLTRLWICSVSVVALMTHMLVRDGSYPTNPQRDQRSWLSTSGGPIRTH